MPIPPTGRNKTAHVRRIIKRTDQPDKCWSNERKERPDVLRHSESRHDPRPSFAGKSPVGTLVQTADETDALLESIAGQRANRVQLTVLTNGKIERWHQTLKADCLRPGVPLSLYEARRLVTDFVEHYNHARLHSAISYVAPADMLAGREPAIFAQRDHKLAAARERRARRRRELAWSSACAPEHRERPAGPGAAMSTWSPEPKTPPQINTPSEPSF